MRGGGGHLVYCFGVCSEPSAPNHVFLVKVKSSVASFPMPTIGAWSHRNAHRIRTPWRRKTDLSAGNHCSRSGRPACRHPRGQNNPHEKLVSGAHREPPVRQGSRFRGRFGDESTTAYFLLISLIVLDSLGICHSPIMTSFPGTSLAILSLRIVPQDGLFAFSC